MKLCETLWQYYFIPGVPIVGGTNQMTFFCKFHTHLPPLQVKNKKNSGKLHKINFLRIDGCHAEIFDKNLVLFGAPFSPRKSFDGKGFGSSHQIFRMGRFSCCY